jgi:hypothetical protein
MENQNITTQEKAKWEVPSNNQRNRNVFLFSVE